MSEAESSAADVIPVITVILRLLAKETVEDDGIKTMKGTLLEAVKRRFSDVEKNPNYSIACLLDPRYKDRFFSNTDSARLAKDLLIHELEKLAEPIGETDQVEPPVKRPRTSEKPSSNLDCLFQEIAEEHASVGCPPAASAIQVDTYLAEPTVSREHKPLHYWMLNQDRFPSLAKTATKYLSAPCSSVESERLFSSVSNILEESRSRLSAENTERLLFIKKNLPLTF